MITRVWCVFQLPPADELLIAPPQVDCYPEGRLALTPAALRPERIPGLASLENPCRILAPRVLLSDGGTSE